MARKPKLAEPVMVTLTVHIQKDILDEARKLAVLSHMMGGTTRTADAIAVQMWRAVADGVTETTIKRALPEPVKPPRKRALKKSS